MDKAFLKSPSRLALIACIVIASVMTVIGSISCRVNASFTVDCYSLAVAMMAVGTGQRYGAKLQERKIIESEKLGNNEDR